MINLSDYTDFFIFLGGLLLTAGVVYALFGHRLQSIFISEEAISRLQVSKQISTYRTTYPVFKNVDSQTLLKKLSVILLIIIIAGFLFNQFLMWKMGSSGIIDKLFSISINITRK